MELISKLSDKQISNIVSSLDIIILCSIDVGVENFCIRIEERHRVNNNFIQLNTILYDKIALGDDREISLMKYFESMIDIIKVIDGVIIEKQINSNVTMMVFEKFIQCYFVFYVKNIGSNLKFVKTVGASTKYSRLNIFVKGVKKNMKKNIISPDRASKILQYYGCDQDLYVLNNSTKVDDYSDVVLLIESFLSHYDKQNRFHSQVLLEFFSTLN